MTIFLDSDSLVLVQEMAGAGGRKHTRYVLNTGTQVIGKVNPRKAGTILTFEVEGYGPAIQRVGNGDAEVPIFNTVAEGMATAGADTTVISVPPAFAKDAALEAIDTGIRMIVVIIEGIPAAGAAVFINHALEAGVYLIDPNYPGIISPGQSDVGITPADITGPSRIGLVSKSGTPTYQLMYEFRDIDFTTHLGIGGDPAAGTIHADALKAFEADPDTGLVVVIGEIDGDTEERAATWIAEHMTKPVVNYIAGFTAPEGKAMGHAGAIVSGSSGTATAEAEALEAVDVKVGRTPSQTTALACQILQG